MGQLLRAVLSVELRDELRTIDEFLVRWLHRKGRQYSDIRNLDAVYDV